MYRTDEGMPLPQNLYELACVMYRERFQRDLKERIEGLAATYPVVSVGNPFDNINNEPTVVTEFGKLSRNVIRQMCDDVKAATFGEVAAGEGR